MKNNQTPSYYASQHRDQDGDKVSGVFDVYEMRGGESEWIFKLHNGGDRLGNLLKRGIPTESAKALFYQMDGI